MEKSKREAHGKVVRLVLAIRVLTFVRRANTSVESDFHGLGFLGLPPFLPFSWAALAFALDLTEPPSLPSAAASFEICFRFTFKV